MLNVCIDTIGNLKHLNEEILEQLGKQVVSFDLIFDVGYFVASSRRICFVNTDNIKMELTRLRDSGKSLWCEGKSLRGRETICFDDDDDESTPCAKQTKLEEKSDAYEAKVKKS